jgi:hypothetical protein
MYNFRLQTGAMSGLQGLTWNAFTATPASTTSFAQITPPSFVCNKLTTTLVGQATAGATFTLTAALGILPAWAIPGAHVAVNVTLGGIFYKFSALIRDTVPSSGLVTFVLGSQNGNPSLILGKNTAGVVTPFTNQNLDSIGGNVVNTVTLNAQCQKAMFQVPSGNAVILAPVADANGVNAPYSVTLAAGGNEYEITAPTGAKFNLADFWIMGSGGLSPVTIRFL